MQTNLDALTIGPLAIEPRFQKLGLSRLLMQGIDDLAAELGASVAYLVGIRGFYRRYKYYPLLSRSKLAFNAQDFYSMGKVKLHPFEERYLPDMMTLFEQNSQLYSCASIRTEDDWEWLTRYARNTYYFFQPLLVIADKQVVGYFCSDPREPGRIRESVHAIDKVGTGLFLNGIAEHSVQTNLSSVEIMTAAGSPLYTYIKLEGATIFTEIIESNGGQLMKIFDYDRIATKVIAPAGLSLAIDSHGKQVTLALSPSAGELKGTPETIFDIAYLPGVLSGYLPCHTTDGRGTGHPSQVDTLLRQAHLKSPFIYQGDNY